ncbi:Htur_1727 family rSAM-partnered candidate RiPP [Halomicrobium sp. LC1Hm]|uniref:Htur_1727 family rSAM-partnered candidate RiPP n=1 Tax=Halomicrobium sp. LC1Hm TaxID=2610902 RepID=UPI00129849FA|nr:Htur_1727 family rSAM-partnered candidate RiPP [Halomicrobium sp. LC1Hm]QGA82361.1 putative enzyme of phenylacetate metabolism, PaaB family [Halomicrobium sp. LC1Hm]
MPDDPLSVTVDEPREAVTREWELFVRESPEDALTHAGSVSAPSADIAREQARQLFEWTAGALWLCPADEVERVQTEAASPVAATEVDEA